MKFDITPDELKQWGHAKYATLSKLGFESKPIMKFGEIEYLILHQPALKPGRQTADVINVTDFDHDSSFAIARDDAGNGFMEFADEGMAVLVIYTDKNGEQSLTDYVHPPIAVLTYSVQPPSRDDVRQTADEMDDELQNSVDNGGALRLW